MFKLHIYNPEHDIALGKNEANFTPAKAARSTKERFWYIPIYWAEEGDWILKEEPTHVLSREGLLNNLPHELKFVSWEELKILSPEEMPSKIEPWGWDRLIVSQLVKCNPLFKALVPSDDELDKIRKLSSREFAALNILPKLVALSDDLIGEAKVFDGTVDELEEIVKNSGSIVLKSPWSCSGRGVRFIEGELSGNDKGWIRNVLAEQGTIMIEPKYNKVLDFAMEFEVRNSKIEYHSLNVFKTHEGKYLQNIEKEELSTYQIDYLLEIIRDGIIKIVTEILGKHSSLFNWIGSFGVDMMIIKDANSKTKVHPCVEMNLRRTMGQI